MLRRVRARKAALGLARLDESLRLEAVCGAARDPGSDRPTRVVPCARSTARVSRLFS